MTITPVSRDDTTAAFLDGTARGEFLIKRSRGTGELLGPQLLVDSTGSADLELVAASGTGHVVSWSVAYSKPVDGVQQPTGVVAIIELAEGPWWWCEVLDAEPAQLRAGLPVQLAYVRPDGSDETIPVCRVRR